MRSFYYIHTRTEKCSFKKNLSRERETRDQVFLGRLEMKMSNRFFFGKKKFYWFQERYIEVIHHLEKFSISAQRAHNLQKFDKNLDTLITVDHKTTPPPICPDKKKIFGRLRQKRDAATRKFYKVCLWRTAHVRSQCVVEKLISYPWKIQFHHL